MRALALPPSNHLGAQRTLSTRAQSTMASIHADARVAWRVDLLPMTSHTTQAYPGYVIWSGGPAQSMSASAVLDWQTSFGAHCIVSSPLIMSFDIRPNSNAVDMLWSVYTKRTAHGSRTTYNAFDPAQSKCH